MISRLHDKLGTAGLIVAVVALIAAVTGTAIAAGGLTKQQEKQVKKIAKKYAGKQGPKGDPGAPGANGSNGTNGSPGAAGANGKGVVVTGSASGCAEDGITVEVEGSGNEQEICNGVEGEPGESGEDGQPWVPDNALPGNATETGAWGFSGNFSPSLAPIVPISFPIPLAAPLGPTAVHLINNNGEEVTINESDGSREEDPPTACGAALTPAGTADAPAAAPGHLCVYSAINLGNLGANTFIGSNVIHTPGSACEGFGCLGNPGPGTGTTGALIGVFLEAEEAAKAWGTWAVTAAP